MTRAARYAYLALAWAFLVGVVVQVFFIGLALFAGSSNIELHVTLGWILHLAPILILGAAALARAGRTRILEAAALAAVVFVVPILPSLRDGMPVIAALHPVFALASFWLAVVVARSASAFASEARSEGELAAA
ncbi:MAG: DUF6220 domain-containing protein [Chloroflexota bacterium]|jgi:hypothetical protein|nr:DUF6220 domain-containing protein [Chloroflexota bacterium]